MKYKNSVLINLIASIVAFGVNIIINFFLTPFIVDELGVEAYGFYSLGINFITYVSILNIALNSMAGRFITIELHKNNIKQANVYFTSVIYANIFLTIFLLIPTILVIIYLDKLLNIPSVLVQDVKLLFSLLFANFFINIIFSHFSVSIFATNRLYLASLRNIESNIIKLIVILGLFVFFTPAVSYMGIATLAATIYITLFYLKYYLKYLPQIKLKKIYFNISAIKEIISSGWWNALTHLGQVLLQSLNVLISNTFLGPKAMGTMAIVYIIPTFFSSLIGSIVSVFSPKLTIYYAKKNMQDFWLLLRKSMLFLSVITTLPLILLFNVGDQFFTLWMPSENAELLRILSILAVAGYVVSGSMNSIYTMFTVVNKIKLNSIVILVAGVVNLILIFILNYLDCLNLVSLVVLNAILSVIRNLFFTIPYGARILKVRKRQLYSIVLKSIITITVVIVIIKPFTKLINQYSWLYLFIESLIIFIITMVTNFYILLNKNDRKAILNKIKRN